MKWYSIKVIVIKIGKINSKIIVGL